MHIFNCNNLTCLKKTVRNWRNRANLFFLDWLDNPPKANQVDDLILNLLEDKPRSGAPATFIPEQICAIVAIALEDPKTSNRPISFWSNREIAAEAIKREIVPSISASTIGNILREISVRPHKSKYWLTPKIKDKEQLNKEIATICRLYESVEVLAASGTKLASLDEKTGMQANERISPDKPMRPGSDVKIEYEYKRHGTQCLTPTFDVLTGKIICHQLGDTRLETDFVEHIKNTVATSPDSNWIFVMDQLNTHKSEGLVRYFAKINGFTEDLGIKGESGILKDQKSREEFLTRNNQRLQIQYTPKHCSWMNQIEIWFGIFQRKALRRASFTSINDLKEKVNSFIEYYNNTMAKPFSWTYKGKALSI